MSVVPRARPLWRACLLSLLAVNNCVAYGAAQTSDTLLGHAAVFGRSAAERALLNAAERVLPASGRSLALQPASSAGILRASDATAAAPPQCVSYTGAETLQLISHDGAVLGLAVLDAAAPPYTGADDPARANVTRPTSSFAAPNSTLRIATYDGIHYAPRMRFRVTLNRGLHFASGAVTTAATAAGPQRLTASVSAPEGPSVRSCIYQEEPSVCQPAARSLADQSMAVFPELHYHQEAVLPCTAGSVAVDVDLPAFECDAAMGEPFLQTFFVAISVKAALRGQACSDTGAASGQWAYGAGAMSRPLQDSSPLPPRCAYAEVVATCTPSACAPPPPPPPPPPAPSRARRPTDQGAAGRAPPPPAPLPPLPAPAPHTFAQPTDFESRSPIAAGPATPPRAHPGMAGGRPPAPLQPEQPPAQPDSPHAAPYPAPPGPLGSSDRSRPGGGHTLGSGAIGGIVAGAAVAGAVAAVAVALFGTGGVVSSLSAITAGVGLTAATGGVPTVAISTAAAAAGPDFWYYGVRRRTDSSAGDSGAASPPSSPRTAASSAPSLVAAAAAAAAAAGGSLAGGEALAAGAALLMASISLPLADERRQELW